jgi:hypothetical protein
MGQALAAAAQIRDIMAFDRKTFKDKLLGVLSGAITHFYMVKLATQNRQTKWVQHWKTEIDRLVNLDTVTILVSEIKGHWDKGKALAESIRDVRSADSGYRRVAANYVARVYQLKKLRKDLPQGIEAEFYAMIEEAAERALSPDA